MISGSFTMAEIMCVKLSGNTSQIILMSFLQKVMFDERMTELEFEMFNGMWNVTGT
jgi:hypothetical protein